MGPVADRAVISAATPVYPEWAKRDAVDAGVAGYAERVLYLKGDLVESKYDDEFKQQLLDELEQAKHK